MRNRDQDLLDKYLKKVEKVNTPIKAKPLADKLAIDPLKLHNPEKLPENQVDHKLARNERAHRRHPTDNTGLIEVAKHFNKKPIQHSPTFGGADNIGKIKTRPKNTPMKPRDKNKEYQAYLEEVNRLKKEQDELARQEALIEGHNLRKKAYEVQHQVIERKYEVRPQVYDKNYEVRPQDYHRKYELREKKLVDVKTPEIVNKWGYKLI